MTDRTETTERTERQAMPAFRDLSVLSAFSVLSRLLGGPPMSDRIHNFSAGPAVLPEPVLRKAQEAIWDVAGSGIGIMEHSHRGKVFDKILADAEANCRELAGIPTTTRSCSCRAAPRCSSRWCR